MQKGAVDDLVLLESISEDGIMANLGATFKQVGGCLGGSVGGWVHGWADLICPCASL